MASYCKYLRPLPRSICVRRSFPASIRPITRARIPPHQPARRHLHITRPCLAATPKYTSEAYPSIQRDSRFSELTEEHVNHFKTILKDESASSLIESLSSDASDDIEPYNTDWMGKYRGQTKLVLRPSSTAQVSQILKYCNDNSLAVVPQGGNTGLVGGSVPVFDEIVLNLGRMAKIRSFDEVSGIFVADAGLVLENADNYLAERGYIYPLDLGAKGSCQLGGTVATNAGGLRLLRYGGLHGNILGLEVVLADGTIVDDLGTLRKNNTGYDIKQLFIGAEGTLGIITAISILCPQRGTAVNVAAFGVESFEKCQTMFREAKKGLSEIISAFEFMDNSSQKALKTAKDQFLPLENEYPFYCLIETSGSNPDHDQEKLESLLSKVMEEEVVSDGVVAQDETQAKGLWSCREGITEALNHWGGVYKYDLSLPLQDLYKIVDMARDRLREKELMAPEGSESSDKYPVVDVVSFGHMGDGNVHLNIPVREYSKDVEEALEPWVYEQVHNMNGSISAEHGLGLQKKPYVGYSRSENMVKLMKEVKNAWDEKGILNPYKYI